MLHADAVKAGDFEDPVTINISFCNIRKYFSEKYLDGCFGRTNVRWTHHRNELDEPVFCKGNLYKRTSLIVLHQK